MSGCSRFPHTRLRAGGLRALAAVALIAAALAPRPALAAGGAFAVDDSGVDDAGACKVESFAAFAGNSDFIGSVAPACVVNFGRNVELGAQVQRFRSGGAWGTTFTAKGKTNIIPVERGGFGLALSGGLTYDVTNRVTNGVFLNVPLTFEVNKQFRINLNGGWLWDPSVEQHFATWGAGFEWKFAEASPFTLIGEVFGVAGNGANTNPRAQAGLRYTPVESLDIDVIYGRNLTGEDSNWITVGLNVRFNVAGK
jgi:hypothetical protein